MDEFKSCETCKYYFFCEINKLSDINKKDIEKCLLTQMEIIAKEVINCSQWKSIKE